MFDWDTGGGIRYDSEEYRTKILKQDGGPGSGRYPKGSGKNPRSGGKATYEEHPAPDRIGHVDFNDHHAVMELLKNHEKEILSKSTEHAIVVCKDGEVYRCYGGKNGVWPDSDLGEKLKGAYMTHNHPSGSNNEYSFSEMDINLFVDYDLKVLRGVDEKYTYQFSKVELDIDSQLGIEVWRKYPGEMNRHAQCIKFAESRGIGYVRKRR